VFGIELQVKDPCYSVIAMLKFHLFYFNSHNSYFRKPFKVLRSGVLICWPLILIQDLLVFTEQEWSIWSSYAQAYSCKATFCNLRWKTSCQTRSHFLLYAIQIAWFTFSSVMGEFIRDRIAQNSQTPVIFCLKIQQSTKCPKYYQSCCRMDLYEAGFLSNCLCIQDYCKCHHGVIWLLQ